MAAKDKQASTERTSSKIASMAGQVLGGRQTVETLGWLEGKVSNPDTPEDDRGHFMVLLGLVTSLKRIAGSALTQR